MKKILFIELCNFKDYPLGGHLSFALHLCTAMKGDIDLVGVRTDDLYPERTWSYCELCGYKYHFYNVKNQHKSFKKPIIPGRVRAYFTIKKCIKEILAHKAYDIIIIQTPEVLLSLPKDVLHKVCLIMPGVGNPLQISRYKWAQNFASIYDRVFFSYAKHVKIILPAADKKAINEFVVRSRGSVAPDMIVQFPTRYDADVFKILQKHEVRKNLGIAEDELMLVTTGRLNWFKGWKFLIDSLNLFRKNHKNARLYFLGKGEDEQRIREYITKVGLENAVVLAGVHPLSVVSEYLNAADMFIMGSYAEGWSTSLVEAVACANPCVVTEFSSAHDLVKDGENGFVETERNEIVFAELMDKALNLDMSIVENSAHNAYAMSVQTMREQLNNILHFE